MIQGIGMNNGYIDEENFKHFRKDYNDILRRGNIESSAA